MTEKKPHRITIPKYTLGEELMSAISQKRRLKG